MSASVGLGVASKKESTFNQIVACRRKNSTFRSLTVIYKEILLEKLIVVYFD
jgi:hypothetical protein